MMQVVADAGRSGNLSGVWDLRGPLVATVMDGLLVRWPARSPFAVLLATWAISLLLTQLMYFVNAWVGAKVERVLLVRTSGNGSTTTSSRCRWTSSSGRAPAS